MIIPNRTALILLTAFLALTAIGGGIALLMGVNTPPIELLHNSPFNSYLIPGLALLILVGGTSFLASIMLFLARQQASIITLASSISIMIFEIVEVTVIGSPKGIARNLQIFYFALGFITGILAWRSKTKGS